MAVCGAGLLVGPFGMLVGQWGPEFPLTLGIIDPFVLEISANGLWFLSSLIVSYPFVTRRWSFQSLTILLSVLYSVWIVELLAVFGLVGGDVETNLVLVGVLTVGAYGAAVGSWTLSNRIDTSPT